MKNNREKFLELVSNKETTVLKEAQERLSKAAMLQESGRIAIQILLRLDELGWTQKDLATKMQVSPQHINKIVKGQENLTLETIVNLQHILQMGILNTFAKSTLNNQKQALRSKNNSSIKSRTSAW